VAIFSLGSRGWLTWETILVILRGISWDAVGIMDSPRDFLKLNKFFFKVCHGSQM